MATTIAVHTMQILLNIHQYRVQIIYKPGPEIFIADWLSQHNHKDGKRQAHQRYGYKNRCHTKCDRHPRNVSPCHRFSKHQCRTWGQSPTTCLKDIIITVWLSTKDELHSDLGLYWSYRDDLAVIDGVVMKGRCIIIPVVLRHEVLDQLHLNHMHIEKTKLLGMQFSILGWY